MLCGFCAKAKNLREFGYLIEFSWSWLLSCTRYSLGNLHAEGESFQVSSGAPAGAPCRAWEEGRARAALGAAVVWPCSSRCSPLNALPLRESFGFGVFVVQAVLVGNREPTGIVQQFWEASPFLLDKLISAWQPSFLFCVLVI